MKTLLAPVLGAVLTALIALWGCDVEVIDPGGSPPVDIPDDDPLRIERTVDPGSLDDIFERIIRPSCAGQPGLCHNGQFEPNLSTPALTFETMVTRPSLERRGQERVVPGDPAKSLLMDKLRNQNVISQMPLGARSLSEEDIQAIEQWIERGAKRRESDGPLPKIDNPPEPPEFALYDTSGARLDPGGGAVAKVGTQITFRMSTNDFEVPDPSIPYAFFMLQTSNNEIAIINPTGPASIQTLGVATYNDVGAPESKGERLNWGWEYQIPPQLDVIGEGDKVRSIDTAGESLLVLAAYYDRLPDNGGLLALSFRYNGLRVEP